MSRPRVQEAETVTTPSPAARREHYRAMLRSRVVEEGLRSLYRQGRIVGGVYLGLGQEALSAACGLSLRAGRDIFAPLIRDCAGRLAFGETLVEALRVYLGRATSRMRGRDGNIHRGDLDLGLLPMISHLGAMVPAAAGMLLARRLRGQDDGIALASVGDGAMATGALHEGINAAAVLKLPLVVVVANNGYSYSTPNSESFACAELLDRAAGYGVEGRGCDGSDPAACLETVGAACARARAGGGVQMVVAKLLRLSGHGEHDDARYIPAEVRAAHRDSITVGAEQLLDGGQVEANELVSWRAEFETEWQTSLAQVEAEPLPDPAAERWSAYRGYWPFPATRSPG